MLLFHSQLFSKLATKNNYNKKRTGDFRVHLNLHFKSRLSAKSLLWKSVFIHIEIGTIYHKNFALTFALKERLGGTRKWPIAALTHLSPDTNPTRTKYMNCLRVWLKLTVRDHSEQPITQVYVKTYLVVYVIATTYSRANYSLTLDFTKQFKEKLPDVLCNQTYCPYLYNLAKAFDIIPFCLNQFF